MFQQFFLKYPSKNKSETYLVTEIVINITYVLRHRDIPGKQIPVSQTYTKIKNIDNVFAFIF